MPLYYLDENGEKQDERLHREILAEGDNEAALEVSREILREFGLLGKEEKAFNESDHPRGQPENAGQFGPGGGGGGEEATAAPVAAEAVAAVAPPTGADIASAERGESTVEGFKAREQVDLKPITRSKENIALWKEDNFARLNVKTAEVTGSNDGQVLTAYNCVGSAMDDKSRWWFPFKAGDTSQNCGEFFWPSEAKRGTGTAESEVKAFDDLFVRVSKGSVTKNEKPEAGFVKMAMFTLRGRPVHIARQVSTGQWLSKIGFAQQITHDLHDLDKNQSSYGNVSKIYKVPVEEFIKLRDMK